VEKEIDPYEPEFQAHRPAWKAIDATCNIIFIIELMINFYGSFWRPFLKDGWNYLDVVVVFVGITSLAEMDLGPFAQIKVLRAFRVLRLFKRIKSLKKILDALVKSIPGVVNAFAVLLIFMCIFAIVAVDAFRDFGSDGTYETEQKYGFADARWGIGQGMNWTGGTYETELGVSTIESITMRGFHYGQEYFGQFSRSLYTLFQVMTGESWSEAVVRPLIFGEKNANAVGVSIFFVVYILLTQVVLQNVVVAVLLDNFSTDSSEEESDAPKDAAASAPAASESPAGASGAAPSGGAQLVAAELPQQLEHIMNEQKLIKAQLKQILDRLGASAMEA